MKKGIFLFLLFFTVGLVNISAQITTKMQRDTMMRRDSMMQKEMKVQKDNPMPTDDRLQRDDRRPAAENKAPMEKKMPTDDRTSMNRNSGTTPKIEGWPEASRKAVEEITAKYGQPDISAEEEMIWMDKGVWKKICISKKETKHSFPIEHTDMMQSTISYKVPVSKMDDLGMFDGSVTFDRTQGTMSARCDVEANNILALNLANEIVTGKLTVRQARVAFANIVKEKKNGGNPMYMQKLLFSPHQNAADPDVNTTGLTKADVMKGAKMATDK